MVGASAASAAPKPQALRPAAVATSFRLDVFSAHDSTLRPPSGGDSCAPYAGMHLSAPGTPSGCATGPVAPFAYKWIINEDNTGDPHQASPAPGPGALLDNCHPVTAVNTNGDPAFPDNCLWPSIHPVLASAVVTQGESTGTTAWNLTTGPNLSLLPAGNYLVSVSADGFEIGGAHFTLPLSADSGAAGTIHVGLNPYPIPLGTIQVKVFNDSAPADGMFDATTEQPIEGFNATISDILGQVSTDWYVNPICTEYERIVPARFNLPPGTRMTPQQADGIGVAYEDFIKWAVFLDGDGSPVRVPGTGGTCSSDMDGIVRIPNLGTNRYSITVAPPVDLDNQDRWAQTTTLEGGHDWDFWLLANDSGLDTELVQAGEPVPWAQFGFVDLGNALHDPPTGILDGPASNVIKGTVMAAEPYVPGQGGLVGQGGANGQSGLRYSHPMDRVWIALNDLEGNGDRLGYTTLVNADGTFNIAGVGNGTYQMGVWDVDQDYAFDSFNVTVLGGTVDLGNVPLLGWFTRVTGTVFIDSNANGKRDPGEEGVPNFDVTIKNRTNDLYVSGQNVSTTDVNGDYHIKEGYPTGAFIIEEFFNTRYKTTGVTYQADNDLQEHTTLTAAVDISVNPIIGQNGRVDIGVLPYDDSPALDNNPATKCDDACQGGIVATVAYDATRNELQARKAATEDYEPGIPGITVNLAKPVPCGTSTSCDSSGRYEIDPTTKAFLTVPVSVGAVGSGADAENGNYLTETWTRPAGCVPHDSNGNVVAQDAIKMSTAGRHDHDCVEATMLGTTFAFADGGVDGFGNFVGGADGQSVDGNYGFVTWHDGDYIVSLDIPTDPIYHLPLYKVRTEDPINVFTGDVYVPQGADVSGLTFSDFLKANRYDGTTQIPAVGLREPASTSGPYPNATCVGPTHISVLTDPNSPTYNPDLMNVGGSPYEGLPVAGCESKLIHVEAGQSVAPNFNLYTDVPIPAKYYGYVTDDVSVSTDKRSTALGEVQGVGDIPVGIYDWTNRLLTVTDTDPNGLFELLMPSTNSYNCPVPAGPCAGMYRFVGNDPGQYSHPNANYNPAYRTIAANFQAWPGIFTAADTAPTRTTVQIEGPGSQFSAVAVCKAKVSEPQLFRISQPYVRAADFSRTYNGANGRTNGSGVTTSANRSKLATRTFNFFSGTDVGRTVTISGETVPAGTKISSFIAQHAGDGATTNSGGVTTLTTPAEDGTLTFTPDDVGSIVTSNGPGADLPDSASNSTTIESYIDMNTVTLRTTLASSTLALSTRTFTVRPAVLMSQPHAPTTPANRVSRTITLGGLGGVTNGTTTFEVRASTSAPFSFTAADVGKTISGSGVLSGTRTIVSVTDSTHVVMSANAASGTNLTFTVASPSNTTPITIKGVGFGAAQGNGNVLLERIAPLTGTISPFSITSWSNTEIRMTVSNSVLSSAAPYHLVIRTGTNPSQDALNTVTFHVLGTGYNPTVYEVGPGRTFQPDHAVDANGVPVFAFPGAIQRGIEAASNGSAQALVVVYPNDPADGGQLNPFSPNGAYYENLILHTPVKLQGVGPGGLHQNADGSYSPVIGSVIDGRYFWSNTTSAATTTDTNPGDELYSFQWSQLFLALQLAGFGGNQAEAEGAVILALGGGDPIGVVDGGTTAWPDPVRVRNFTTGFKGSVDGFTITGGDQKAFPGTRNEAGGGPVPSEGPYVEVAGGGIFLNGYNHFMQITNNQVLSNSGTFAGGVRVGSPQIGSSHNVSVRIAYNRIVANGGTNLAGSVGIYNGTDSGRIDHNQICGNFSAEYGGAISHFGLSRNNTIDHNKIYLNESVDEGGGVMIAGEIPTNPDTLLPMPDVLTQGSGEVSVHDNYIAANVGGDDGGGIRTLQAGNWPIDVYNNMINDNVSTHEGGGIALDDTTNARIYNNTIAKNITTATAVTSNGQAAPAGLSTAPNSSLQRACNVASPTRVTSTAIALPIGSVNFLFSTGFTQAEVGATVVAAGIPVGTSIVSVQSPTQARLSAPAYGFWASVALYAQCNGQPPVADSSFSNPLLFNNVFDDNRAGTWVGSGTTPGVVGIGLTDFYHWDMGVAGGALTDRLSPTDSVINDVDGHGFVPDASNNPVLNDPPGTNRPNFRAPFDLGVSISPWRVQPRFRPTAIVGVTLPDNAIGDYRLKLTGGSPAIDNGANSKNGVNAPLTDIEGEARPLGAIDEGADEIPPPSADLAITKSDGVSATSPGASLTYSVVVTNNGPFDVANAPVTDTFPTGLTVTSWTCIASAGSSCTTGGAGNARTGTVTLLNGGSATFTGLATVAAPVLPVPVAYPAFPGTQPLDNFNRGDAVNLGSSWNQPALVTIAAINVNSNQASAPLLAGQAIWNVPSTGFGAKQAAAFTFANTPVSGTSLFLKATGGTTNLLGCNPIAVGVICSPSTFVRARYAPTTSTLSNIATVAAPAGIVDPTPSNNSAADDDTITTGQVVIESTVNGNGGTPTYTSRGTLSGTFATGDRLTAQASVVVGSTAVDLWKTTGVTNTYLGRVTFAGFTGTGRVGMQLPPGARVDDFRGGTIP